MLIRNADPIFAKHHEITFLKYYLYTPKYYMYRQARKQNVCKGGIEFVLKQTFVLRKRLKFIFKQKSLYFMKS